MKKKNTLKKNKSKNKQKMFLGRPEVKEELRKKGKK